MPNLLVVESPAKVRTISSYLGKDYKVVATLGHLLDLPSDRLGVRIEEDFEPEYVPLKGKKNLLSSILKEAKAASQVYIATDPDREGEFIGSILSERIGKKKPVHRIRFQEISKDSILRAIENPDKIDSSLVDSQKARRILDRLIGYKVSPFLWKAITSGLSAGRVQSVALKWICEREQEIRAFIPETTWVVSAPVRYGKGEKEIVIFHPDLEPFRSEKQATDFLKDILKKTKELLISDRKEKTGETLPPPPFTTAALQQEAFRVLKFPASKTMRIAQELYEGVDLGGGKNQGLITYMRTDSTRISLAAADSLRKKARSLYGDSGVSEDSGKYRAAKGKGKAQDAHEAIRPVDPFLDPNRLRGLGKDAVKLYELIWKRAIASQMKPEQWKRLEFVAEAGGSKWKGEKAFTLHPGYKVVYEIGSEKLPAWKKGDRVRPESWDLSEKTTEPPSRYTEASLIAKMEKEGIGRPSTFAAILETLYKRKYVQTEKARIFANPLGEKVNSFLQSAFSDLFREKFTSEMEGKLDSIALGKESRSAVLAEFYSFLESKLKKANIGKLRADWKEEVKNTPIYGICPLCKQGERVKKISSKKKQYYICSRFPDCDYAEYL